MSNLSNELLKKFRKERPKARRILEKEEKLRATTKVGYQRDEIHNNGTITQYIFVTS